MGRLNKKNIVVHANCFSSAIDKKMTPVEQRMLAIYLSKLNPNDLSTREVMFSLDEYEDVMGLEKRNLSHLQKCAQKIIQTPVIFSLPSGGFDACTVFSRFKLDKIDDIWTVMINCSDTVLPYLFNLKKEFVKYELWNVLNLNEINHQQMYRLLKQYENIGHREIEIQELKFRLGVHEKYQEFKDFKKSVLEPCKKALAQYTDICFEYDTIRKGRKIHTIHFLIHKNEKKPDQFLLSDYISENIKNMNEFIPSLPVEDDMTAFQYNNPNIELLAEACDKEFSQDEVQVLFDLIAKKSFSKIEMKDLDISRYHYLKEKYDEMKMRNPNQSRFGYLKTILKYDLEHEK